MPKENIDYSNTIIYKIYCKDETIKDIYVGHTTNFIRRKFGHKMACNNLNNTLKIYNTIRSNGGWENWDMVEIAKYCCKNSTEARMKEQLHYDELKSSLNSVPPYVDKTLYFCSKCNLQCISPKRYKQHVSSNKHIQNMNNDIIDNKKHTGKKYSCEICEYITYRKSSYDKHLTTSKHLTRFKDLNETFAKSRKQYTCVKCNKVYKDSSGLWRHNKICHNIQHINTDEAIMMLVKQNSELIKEMSEIKICMMEFIKNVIQPI